MYRIIFIFIIGGVSSARSSEAGGVLNVSPISVASPLQNVVSSAHSVISSTHSQVSSVPSPRLGIDDEGELISVNVLLENLDVTSESEHDIWQPQVSTVIRAPTRVIQNHINNNNNNTTVSKSKDRFRVETV